MRGRPNVISSAANEVSGVEKSRAALRQKGEISPLRRYAPPVEMTGAFYRSSEVSLPLAMRVTFLVARDIAV